MAEQEPCRLTATKALDLIRSNKLTVEAYARSLLSRIESRNAAVKAWAYLDPELVLEQARRLDEIPVDKRGPLHGLPVGIKDIMHTKDMPTEHNSPIYKNSHVAVDAAPVAVLRAAGALIFGKTATTEFAATTAGPPTRNPHNEAHTPGGSSSGSGAAVADFQVPVALGTQTGGSMVRPGSFNGIYALKPTWNALSREGVRIHSLILDTVGVFARCVEDLDILARVLGVTVTVTHAEPDQEREFEGVSGAKFGIVKGPVWNLAEPGTVSALQKAREILERHGAVVEEVDLPDAFNKIPEWHARIMSGDGGVSVFPEYQMEKSKVHGSLVDFVKNTKGYTRAQLLEAYDGIAMLRPRIDEIAGRYAALITPSVPGEALVGIEWTGEAAFCSMWTALHTPVVNIPGFGGENNLPIGLTLVAPRYHDQHLLSVAKTVGEIFAEEGGWKSTL
ncbi:amidase [Aspergillus lucknowensis]|uniref:Amidase signature domain-containing protein n=1 Tax=Aspergillus lucknowensis TaxID=176173 RepID=A0ABR4LHF7_9EURO